MNALAEKPDDKTLVQKAAELLWKTANLFERHQNESRRHSRPFDPGPTHIPDYGRILRENEGQVEVNIEGGYHEGGGDKHSWKDWILGLVGLLIVAWLGKISLQMDKLTEVVVRQNMQEKQIAEIRCTLYKQCATP